MLAQGIAAQRNRRLEEAMAFIVGNPGDPGNFDAQSSLGLTAFDLANCRNLCGLTSWLWRSNRSFNARFNFGFGAQKGGYIQTRRRKLERLSPANPVGESPAHLAMVHLTLAIYTPNKFHQTIPARAPLFESPGIGPHNSQATLHPLLLQDNG